MSEHKSSPLMVVLAWLVVVAPALWGFTFTAQNAMKLFTASATTAPASAPSAAAH